MHWIASILVTVIYFNQCQCTPKSCCDDSCECCVISKPDPIHVVESTAHIVTALIGFRSESISEFILASEQQNREMKSLSYYLLGKIPSGPPRLANLV